MTEVAEAPTSGQERELKRINHWIGGRSVAGQSGRSGPVYNPATGEQTGAVDFASIEEIDAAVAAGVSVLHPAGDLVCRDLTSGGPGRGETSYEDEQSEGLTQASHKANLRRRRISRVKEPRGNGRSAGAADAPIV